MRRSEHITPVLEYLQWIPVSQRVVFKIALIIWKCVHGVTPAYLSDLCIPTTAISGRQHLRSAATGTLLVPCARTVTGQWSFAVNGPAMWNCLPPALLGPVGERLQAGTEDAPVLDRSAPLRHFHDSGTGYKYSDLLTYCCSQSFARFLITTHIKFKSIIQCHLMHLAVIFGICNTAKSCAILCFNSHTYTQTTLSLFQGYCDKIKR